MIIVRLIRALIKGRSIITEIRYERKLSLDLIERERSVLLREITIKREELMIDTNKALAEIERRKASLERELTQERNLLSEERVKFLNEMTVGIQIEAEMIKDMVGKDYEKRAERIRKNILHIHSQNIENLTAIKNDTPSADSRYGQRDNLSEQEE